MNGIVWDLEALYPSVSAWEADFAQLRGKAEKFAAFKGRLAESPAVLKAAIEVSDEFDRLAEKVYSYAHLRSDENTSIGVNRARVDRVSALLSQLTPLEAWFDPEIMAIPDDRMRELLDAPELAFYRRSLLELLREKPHVLSEAEERLIGMLGDVLGNSDEAFATLNDTDLEFGKVRDGAGKLRVLDHSSWHRFTEDPDRGVRRRAFRKLYRQYRQYRNTFACTLDGTVKRHGTMARVRHYDSALAASLSADNVPVAIYDNLIAAVHAHLPALYEYFDLRSEVLGLPDLNMYDLYAPLRPDCRREYDFSAGSRLVREALAPLGGEYGSLLEKAWRERWIDAVPRKGKRSGAYSGGCYDSYPYVLMSYDGTLDDVFTLAHELGHSMHSYFSRTHQRFHYADYAIFVAEVASTCNELLLSEHLLQLDPDDHAFRAYLYAHLADEIRATVYRQTMFAEFEKFIHEASAAGTPLTADFLCETYYKLNALYHGPGIRADRDIELEWARIPHFYYNFYVYKYATGMSAALRLSRGLLSGDPAKREAYLGFLKAGDSKDVLDIMRDAGVDLATPEPVDSALEFFRTVVAALRQELQSL